MLSFLAGSVLECSLAHRRPVAALCMLFKIKSSSMFSLNDALPLPYVPARVTRGGLVATGTRLRLLAVYIERVTQHHRTAVPFSVKRSYSDPLSDGVGWAGFKSRAYAFMLALSATFFVTHYFLFFFFPWVGCVGL